jgi:GGDEF domain-containing protein
MKHVVAYLNAAITRLGGDALAILLPNIVNGRDAPIIAERILASTRKKFLFDDIVIEVRARIEIFLFSE